MNLKNRIEAIVKLSGELDRMVNDNDPSVEALLKKAYLQNNWFTRENVRQAISVWVNALSMQGIENWLSGYELPDSFTDKTIGVINAGNIPLVGFHDFIAVLLCGHRYLGKNSSDDNILLPYVAGMLSEISPAFGDRIRFTERVSDYDAVIATGSNNSARYFESYFGKVRHIIRKNRNGAGVLTGNETREELVKLGNDIFQYFGLGCRNVSKLYVPGNYDFKDFFEAIFPFNEVMRHNKYMNNFDYNNVVLLMKQIPFLQNGFLIIREEAQIASPISVVHYERYSDQAGLIAALDASENQIQCIVSGGNLELESALKKRQVAFGSAQSPALNDYADGVDTIKFLSAIRD